MRGGVVRLVTLVVLFVLIASGTGTTAEGKLDDRSVASDVEGCGHRTPLDGPAGDDAAVPFCAGGIRPGARMSRPSGCTMNFIVTDGASYYIGTAGHCVDHVGQTVHLSGIGAIGPVVLKGGHAADWAFVQIDPRLEHLIDGTMCIVGGPQATAISDGVRDPLPGESVLHYGHGQGLGEHALTKTRIGTGSVAPPFFVLVAESSEFVFAGVVGPGDSGSPVLLGTGEATGIVSAHLRPPLGPLNGHYPSVVIAARFTAAVAALEEVLGNPVSLVEGAYPAVPPSR